MYKALVFQYELILFITHDMYSLHFLVYEQYNTLLLMHAPWGVIVLQYCLLHLLEFLFSNALVLSL